jgi:hypothetical protein
MDLYRSFFTVESLKKVQVETYWYTYTRETWGWGVRRSTLRPYSHETFYLYCDKKIKRYFDKKIFLSHGFQD